MQGESKMEPLILAHKNVIQLFITQIAVITKKIVDYHDNCLQINTFKDNIKQEIRLITTSYLRRCRVLSGSLQEISVKLTKYLLNEVDGLMKYESKYVSDCICQATNSYLQN